MPLWRPAQYNRIPSTLPKKKKKAIKGAQLPERHQENGTLSFANGKVASGTFGHIFGLKSLNAEQVTIISNQDQKRFQSATVHLTQWTAVAERPKHNAIFPYLDQDQNIFPQITQKPWIRLKERKGNVMLQLMQMQASGKLNSCLWLWRPLPHLTYSRSLDVKMALSVRNFDGNIPLLHE